MRHVRASWGVEWRSGERISRDRRELNLWTRTSCTGHARRPSPFLGLRLRADANLLAYRT